MGVWIEIISYAVPVSKRIVTPYVGVWIEIMGHHVHKLDCCVTPYVGVWIEMPCPGYQVRGAAGSPPMWGCGLKYLIVQQI